MRYLWRGGSEDSNGISIDGGDGGQTSISIAELCSEKRATSPHCVQHSLPYRLQVPNDHTSMKENRHARSSHICIEQHKKVCKCQTDDPCSGEDRSLPRTVVTAMSVSTW